MAKKLIVGWKYVQDCWTFSNVNNVTMQCKKFNQLNNILHLLSFLVLESKACNTNIILGMEPML